MATLQNFDAEIAKTKQVVEEMRTKIDQSGSLLDRFAQADQKIGSAEFDIENARIDDVIKQQKVMEANIADLIIGLEDATNVFGAEFENMKSFSGWETFVGQGLEAKFSLTELEAAGVAGAAGSGGAVEGRRRTTDDSPFRQRGRQRRMFRLPLELSALAGCGLPRSAAL